MPFERPPDAVDVGRHSCKVEGRAKVGVFDSDRQLRYYKGMKSNTGGGAKSSITLPREELQLVNKLKRRLGAKTKVEVIRRGLYLLRDTTDREALRQAYARASSAVRNSTLEELAELDQLSAEGLEDDG
jgi:hypothetical protein